MILNERKIIKQNLFHITEHGHYYLNPYFGCSEGCAQCYWPMIEGWEGQITAWTNIGEIFNDVAQTWDKSKRICFGSLCNPYESIEEQYGLMRELLTIARNNQIPVAVMTSSSLIVRDMDILLSMKDTAVIVFELARISRMTAFKHNGVHDVMDAANVYAKSGFKVMATVSPYLPQITDMEQILTYLDKSIEIYVGELDLKTNPMTEERLNAEIQQYQPELCGLYNHLIGGSYDQCYLKMVDKYVDGNRVKKFPLDIMYEV